MPRGQSTEKQWGDALLLACHRIESGQSEKNITRMAAALVDKAVKGDVVAIKEVGDRIDGKAKESVAVDHGGSALERLLGALDRKTRETRE